jgi:RNA polymerase sigma factor (sigma-70 family)
MLQSRSLACAQAREDVSGDLVRDGRPPIQNPPPAIAPATRGSGDASVGSQQRAGRLSPAAGASTIEHAILPHLDAAYNLALWLTRHRADAEDIVEDVCARAMRSFALLGGDETRVWLLHAVRDAAYARLEARRTGAGPDECDRGGMNANASDRGTDGALATSMGCEPLEAAMATLPVHLLECLVLREMEQLKYKEIARITEVPIETVMSRLHRARRLLMALTVDASGPATTPS